jgi:complex III assembly factor LYRM7
LKVHYPPIFYTKSTFSLTLPICYTGDNPTLLASRSQARSQFRTNRLLHPGGADAGRGIEHAQGVTKILRENVVQGKRRKGEGEQYKLKIHEHTQKLDNDTTKLGKGTVKSFKEIKNATF